MSQTYSGNLIYTRVCLYHHHSCKVSRACCVLSIQETARHLVHDELDVSTARNALLLPLWNDFCFFVFFFPLQFFTIFFLFPLPLKNICGGHFHNIISSVDQPNLPQHQNAGQAFIIISRVLLLLSRSCSYQWYHDKRGFISVMTLITTTEHGWRVSVSQ